MLNTKDLINRRNDNESKECISFEYHLPVENERGMKTYIPVYFRKLAEKYWEITMVSKKSNIGELRAYSCEYVIPTNNMDLTMVAATGLNNLRCLIAEEVQYKSMIDFCIGDSISNML